jgi:hypothetical protein
VVGCAELFQLFGVDTMLIWNAILLKKRVFVYSDKVADLLALVRSVCSLLLSAVCPLLIFCFICLFLIYFLFLFFFLNVC